MPDNRGLVPESDLTSPRFLPAERRAALALAAVYAARMLGLFLVLPVFALHAATYAGGEDARLVGLALGAYGLAQALLLLPLGRASDRWGRRPVIVAGLLLFLLGSVVAALAVSVWGLLLGRALQGAGAVSAAVGALLADHTRDRVRSKAMALVGASIGLSFALSLVLAPPLAAAWGLAGLFWLTAVLALASLLALAAVPAAGGAASAAEGAAAPAQPPVLSEADRRAALRRLHGGVFVLHAVQAAMWLAVPALLTRAGLSAASHGWLYLPVLALSFAAMAAALFPLERRGRLAWAMRAAIAAVLLAQLLLAVLVWREAIPSEPSPARVAMLAAALLVFFAGFNLLEAAQPSQLTRLVPAARRGAEMGRYHTAQSLGIFCGAAGGGWLVAAAGPGALFAATAALSAAWLAWVWARPWREHPRPHPAGPAAAAAPAASDRPASGTAAG